MTGDGFVLHGQPADVDAVVTVDGDHYVLARSAEKVAAVEYRHAPDEEIKAIAEAEDATVYNIDV